MPNIKQAKSDFFNKQLINDLLKTAPNTRQEMEKAHPPGASLGKAQLWKLLRAEPAKAACGAVTCLGQADGSVVAQPQGQSNAISQSGGPSSRDPRRQLLSQGVTGAGFKGEPP